MRKFVTILFLYLAVFLQIFANQSIELSDSATVSLFTCTPGTETYSKYGHSAIRIYDPQQEIDWTFNYGVFNFSDKNFYIKFTKGYTYYQLDLERTDWFIYSSSQIGRTTYEQVLNLTKTEKQALLDALLKNYEPQNRYYLYNFVFDNCATRPYKLMRKVLPTLPAPEYTCTPLTYRQAVRHYSENNSWPGFGIDFVFGSNADRVMSAEESLFLPEMLMNYVANATLPNGEHLCLWSNCMPFIIKSHSWWQSPYFVTFILTIIILIITITDIKRGKSSLWFDELLLFIGGMLGFICFYLSLFSIHPLVENNWNLLSVNPILLLLAITLLIPKCRLWMQKHAIVISLCCLMITCLRIPAIYFQSWHWLMILPIVHSLRGILLSKFKVK